MPWSDSCRNSSENAGEDYPPKFVTGLDLDHYTTLTIGRPDPCYF